MHSGFHITCYSSLNSVCSNAEVNRIQEYVKVIMNGGRGTWKEAVGTVCAHCLED